MKKPALALVVAAVWATAHPSGQPQTAGVTIFTNVSVLPMDRDVVLRDQTVVVRNGRIDQIGASKGIKAPAGAAEVDGRGKFLMPALAEMHAHIPGGKAPEAASERTLLLYIAGGATTIRGMQGDPRHLTLRDRVAKGELLGPRIYAAGPALSGNSVPSVAAGEAAVEAQKAAGYDLLKILPGVTREVFDAIDRKADELKIPFAGHVPADVGLHRALEAKYRSIDHMDGYVEALAKEATKSTFFGANLTGVIDESRIPKLIAETKAAGTWIVPTQSLFDSLLGEQDADTMSKWPEIKYIAADVLAKWVGQKENLMKEFSAEDRQKFLALRRKLLKGLFDAGVPFALGSDAPQWWNVPGFSVHRELQSVVQAGLTPFQALQTGTVNVARYFGTESTTGTVAPNKRADLLLLDRNPLDDISNSVMIAGVMVNGVWIPRAELDKKLAQ